MSQGPNCRGKISGVPGIPVRVTDDGPRGISATRFPREPGWMGERNRPFEYCVVILGQGEAIHICIYIYIYISG